MADLAYSTPTDDRDGAGDSYADMEPLDKLQVHLDEPNVAELLTDEQLGTISQRVLHEFGIDEQSRSEWEECHREALKIAKQTVEAKNYPWPNACYSLDTEILTETGWSPVADIETGERVFSRAPDGTASFYPVSRTYRYTADSVVHFYGKSVDLLVTPNHRMLVEDRDTGESSFIEAGEFVKRQKRGPSPFGGLSRKSIPLTSEWVGESPETIYGVPAKAYMRLLGWFVSEGSSIYARNTSTNKKGEFVDYGLSPSSFSIAQCKNANPDKYESLRADIAACGFSYKAYDNAFILHARSMPQMMCSEWRALGRAPQKHLPNHVMSLSSDLLEALVDTLVMGDGCSRERADRQIHRTYYTTSRQLADQLQDVAQKVGIRAAVSVRAACVGGVINGREIVGVHDGYEVSLNSKPSIQVLKLKRELVPFNDEVACVEVEPHHTLYVRRNGKAVWCGNSNVKYPLLTTAAIQFASRSYPAIVADGDVVKAKVLGEDEGIPMMDPQTGQPVVDPETGDVAYQVQPGAKRERGDRVARYMGWQLMEQMEEWDEDTDKLLHVLPIAGHAYRKTYYDETLGRCRSELVMPDKVAINDSAVDITTVPRITHVLEKYPHEIEERMRGGLWKRQELGLSTGEDKDAPVEFLEQHRLYDLDGDGYEEPYICTVHKDSGKVVRIVANFDAEDVFATEDGDIVKIDRKHCFTKYAFIPNPSGGFHDIGFGMLLRPINEAVNTTLNQLLDAGHLANVGGGFIGSGARLGGGRLRLRPGEWKTVNASGQSLRENIFPAPVKEPSVVLFQLLGTLIEAGKDISSVKDVLTGEQPAGANMPATTTLALIEQGMQVFSAIYKRIYRSLKSEYKKLYRLNAEYINEQTYFTVLDTPEAVAPQDFAEGDFDIIPVADPKVVTNMQKLARAQFLDAYRGDPHVDQLEIRRRQFDAAGIDDIDSLLVEQLPPNPEIMMKADELEIEKRKISQKDAEIAIEAEKTLAEIGKIKADTLKAIADAEAAEAGPQLELYKTNLQDLIERERMVREANERRRVQGVEGSADNQAVS